MISLVNSSTSLRGTVLPVSDEPFPVPVSAGLLTSPLLLPHSDHASISRVCSAFCSRALHCLPPTIVPLAPHIWPSPTTFKSLLNYHLLARPEWVTTRTLAFTGSCPACLIRHLTPYKTVLDALSFSLHCVTSPTGIVKSEREDLLCPLLHSQRCLVHRRHSAHARWRKCECPVFHRP